jgi:glycosyltransferase involved in cell wall biosynthesis
MINYSIIIPTKNVPELLKRCLSTIPIRKDLEVIVVDDNSDDAIVDFNNYLSHSRNDVQMIYSKEGKGAGYARNLALRKAIGRWLIFADSDDFFTANFSEILDAYICSEVDVVYFKTNSVYSENGLPTNRTIGLNNYIDKYLAGKVDALELGLNYAVPWGKFVSRKLVIDNNIEFSETMAANDIMFATRIALTQKEIIVSNEYIYCATLRNNSLTTTPSRHLLDDRLHEYLKRNQFLIDSGESKHLRSVIYLICCYWKYGFRKFMCALWIVLKSDTPIFTGYRNWVKTFFQLKKEKTFKIQN